MKMLDTNALLRYVLNDIPEQAEISAEAVRNGCMTTAEVLAEVAYVLSGVYKMSREDVSWTIHCILIDVKVENVKALRYAIGVYNLTNLDFVDCLLVAYHKLSGIEVLSFDRKLNANLERELPVFQEK